jgi:hypothetical protein
MSRARTWRSTIVMPIRALAADLVRRRVTVIATAGILATLVAAKGPDHTHRSSSQRVSSIPRRVLPCRVYS